MLYAAYQAQSDFMYPVRTWARHSATALAQSRHEALRRFGGSALAAGYELLGRAGLTHHRPSFGIAATKVGNREVAIAEEATLTLPFGTLLRFAKDIDVEQPRVLVVAPLSGHFATLLRNTVEVLLPDHDVYITDWTNARDVGLWHGRFGFDDYVGYLIRFLEALGPGAHVVAVCQPCVQTLAAVSIMAQDDHVAQPASMTLMAGPIDARVNPTKVNELATSKPIEWFERNLISSVPLRYAGAMRRVYPGFVQLGAFMSMNLDRHIKAHVDLFGHLAKGEHEKAKATKDFYDEYFAVLDLTAEFYLETVKQVFQEYHLATGDLVWQGNKVEPRAIRRTALFTVEGERDDICSIGQTVAAHDLCSALRPYRKKHYMQAGVGHYGVFAGKRWAGQIYPILRNVILAND